MKKVCCFVLFLFCFSCVKLTPERDNYYDPSGTSFTGGFKYVGQDSFAKSKNNIFGEILSYKDKIFVLNLEKNTIGSTVYLYELQDNYWTIIHENNLNDLMLSSSDVFEVNEIENGIIVLLIHGGSETEKVLINLKTISSELLVDKQKYTSYFVEKNQFYSSEINADYSRINLLTNKSFLMVYSNESILGTDVTFFNQAFSSLFITLMPSDHYQIYQYDSIENQVNQLLILSNFANTFSSSIELNNSEFYLFNVDEENSSGVILDLYYFLDNSFISKNGYNIASSIEYYDFCITSDNSIVFAFSALNHYHVYKFQNGESIIPKLKAGFINNRPDYLQKHRLKEINGYIYTLNDYYPSDGSDFEYYVVLRVRL